MSRKKLAEKLRKYADIAEAGEKSHWALAMRQAAEYIRADLEKTLPEPFTYIGPSAFEKLSSGYAMSVFCAKQAINKSDIPLYTEPPARKPLSDDEAIMPRQLTAENGAKALFIGEFYEEIQEPCPDCDGGEYIELPTDQCGTCNAIGVVTRRVPVSWATIKAIYAKASEHFAASSGIKEQE